jgi:hypothetical protein
MEGRKSFQKIWCHLKTFRRKVTRRNFRTENPNGLGVTDLVTEFVQPWKNRVRERIVGYHLFFEVFIMSEQFFLSFLH